MWGRLGVSGCGGRLRSCVHDARTHFFARLPTSLAFVRSWRSVRKADLVGRSEILTNSSATFACAACVGTGISAPVSWIAFAGSSFESPFFGLPLW